MCEQSDKVIQPWSDLESQSRPVVGAQRVHEESLRRMTQSCDHFCTYGWTTGWVVWSHDAGRLLTCRASSIFVVKKNNSSFSTLWCYNIDVDVTKIPWKRQLKCAIAA